MKKFLQLNTFLLFSCFFNCQSADLSSEGFVFQESKIIGKIDTETDKQCDRCYSIKTLTINGDLFQFKIPVSINHLSGKNIFQEDYQLTSNPVKKCWMLQYRNVYIAEVYYFQIEKIKQQYNLTKTTKIYNAVKTVKIGPEDYTDFPATAVCIDTDRFLLSSKKLIDLETYFFNIEKTCTYCPVQYTVEECLEKRKLGEEFVWE